MKKVYLALVAMMFAFSAAFAQEDYSCYITPKGSTNLTELTGTEKDWGKSELPINLAVQGAQFTQCFGNGDGGAESTHVNVSGYESITLIVTSDHSTGVAPALRVWFWDDVNKMVVQRFVYPAEEYETANWTAPYNITKPGVYRVNIGSYKYLKGIKAANNWGAAPVTVNCAYCTPVGGDPTPKIVPADTPHEIKTLKPTKEEEVSLTSSMFKGWDSNTAAAKVTNENPWWDGAYGVAKDGGGVIFGNGNVGWLEFADLTGFEKMTIKGNGGELRVMFNRVADQGALTELHVNPTAEGTEIDLNKEFSSFIHLNCIKVQWGATATVDDITLYRSEYTYELEDAACADDDPIARAIVTGAKVLAINPAGKKTVKITDFEGNYIADVPVGVSTYGKLELQFDATLPVGDYYINVAPGTLIINGAVYNQPLKSILAVGEKNELAQEAYGYLQEEINGASHKKEYLIYGVNVYQYAPGLKNKIQAAIDEAAYYGNLLVEEQHIYNTIADLRKYMKSIRPNLPKADSNYAIKHKETGLYLNIEGGVVTLEKEATPVQFHLVDPSMAPTYVTDEYWWGSYSYWKNLYSTEHFAYIYATPERKYLGYNMTEREVGEDEEKYIEVIPTSTNKKNTIWAIYAESTNEYIIEIASDHGETDGWHYLYAPNYLEESEGIEVTCYDYDIDDAKEIEANEEEGKGWGYYWYIEDYVAPKSNLPEGCIAITNEAELEGQTVLIMNAETEKFLYGPNAQNTGVADFETATASTNVVTAYKVEKADNGYLFRCVTPAGGDYSLWGANPCYLNAQPNVGGVSFNLGKDQDIANGSTWNLTYDAKAKVWTIQSVANEGYLAGTTISKDLEAKWVICTALEGTGSSSADDATAISSIETANNAAAIYNAAGVRSNTLQKGINIVKLANGKVVKVMK